MHKLTIFEQQTTEVQGDKQNKYRDYAITNVYLKIYNKKNLKSGHIGALIGHNSQLTPYKSSCNLVKKCFKLK